jgi:hypothetical protein
MNNLTYDEIVALLADMDVDSDVYADVREWREAESNGDKAKLKALDFSVTPMVGFLV